MSRAERLLELIEVLRRHRQPISGRTLAAELDISIRTLYRDIATLDHGPGYWNGILSLWLNSASPERSAR